MRKCFYFFSLVLVFQHAEAQRANITNIENIVSYLSSDELQGRATGTVEEKKAAKFIANKFRILELTPFGNNPKYFKNINDLAYYFDFEKLQNTDVHDTSESKGIVKQGRNVVGFLDNNREYTVVIGAHYDHLGLGLDHNSLDANPVGKIHNGADDNASGIAGLIELANYLTSNGVVEHYNYLFIAFSGEELGLFGSKKWCENPTLPLDKVNYMINLDMIGRLNEETKKLLVYGIGTSNMFETSLDRTNTYFDFKKDSSGVGPSDHTSFYLKNIPVLHFFTGQHSDYHRPTDDAYKVNYTGIGRVVEFLIDLIYDLDKLPKQQFLATKNAETEKMSFKVTMGIMPDYAYEGEGMHIDDVTNGKPASKAGIERGDVIIYMDGKPIGSVMDYMKILNQHKKGDQVEVLIRRGNEVITKMVNF